MAALDGFSAHSFTHDETDRTVYRAGTGPGVIVIHEIPGITPLVADFGRRVAARGFTVVMPSLFGDDGRPPSIGYTVKRLTRACVAREFTCLALGKTSPITRWLRALARDLHGEVGGPGVGAVGMCLTGGFALAMMVDETIAAPVLSQPSLPLPLGRKRSRALGVTDADLEAIVARATAGCRVLGLRFSEDKTSPAARFDTLRSLLGDAFIGVEIDSSPGNPHGIGRSAHSVLTEHLVDEPGHPTHEALERVLDFFEERLAA